MPFARRPRHTWSLRTRSLDLGDRTLIMGILNITPDSFSDGGKFLSADAATEHGLDLLHQGADILDLGAESTRPNASPLSPDEEQDRLLPVLEAVHSARPQAILSVDTYHSSTTRAAIRAGAEIINDVSGLTWDSAMAATLANAHPPPGIVVMHTRGKPPEWHTLPPLEPHTIEPLVRNELRTRLEIAQAAGIELDRIILDPGFGFGKRGPENYTLLAHLSSLHILGRPLLIGLSRKGFLAHPSASDRPQSLQRLNATLAANTAAILAGAHILRIHDVAAAVEAASTADAILSVL